MPPAHLPKTLPTDVEAQASHLRSLLSATKDAPSDLLLEGFGNRRVSAVDPAAVAEFLRSTKESLQDLGVNPDGDASTDPSDSGFSHHHRIAFWWGRLQRCMERADFAEDGLTIFKAMATALDGRRMNMCLPLMESVLACSWRQQAIEAVPGFFRTRRAEFIEVLGREGQPSTAFQVLAFVEQSTKFPYLTTLGTVKALKQAGVEDHPDPNSGKLSLHVAAKRGELNSLKAFAKEFPEQLEAEDKLCGHPLHEAAASESPYSVRFLLEAGAQPRPGGLCPTPMSVAATCKRFDNVMVLIETGAYTDKDVGLAGRSFDDEKRAHLKALHAAVKARQAVDVTALGHPSSISPL